jgi:flagellar biosynthesis/type III secretory pathway protein FliH
MTTTTEKPKYKRRSYQDGLYQGFAKGWNEGREVARKEFEEAYQLLSKHDSALLLEVHSLREQLANVSLRRLAWSRIKGLFAGYGRSESNNELFDDWGKK